MTKTKKENKAPLPLPAGAFRRTAATLPIANLAGAAWNTHHLAKGEDEGFQGLVASMKANGIIQRLVVRPSTRPSAARPSTLEDGGRRPSTARPSPLGQGATTRGATAAQSERQGATAAQSERQGATDAQGEIYEIIDGHRRVEAARALGWTEVPCEIIEGLTDDEAQARTLTANIQRLDNDPLLEAACIERLAKAGKTHEQIAAILGKTARYVARRARLLNLTPEWRGWFGRQQGVTADLMEMVAAHEKALQSEVYLTLICNDDGTVGEDLEIDEDQIDRAFKCRLRRIDIDAPFDTALCATCPNNTATHGWLFPAEADEDCHGRCENAECFVKKWNAATDELIAVLRMRKIKVREPQHMSKWDIPLFYNGTTGRTVKNTEPWVYMESGLKKIVWVEPDKTPSRPEKDARTEAEKKAELHLRARQRAWRTNRDKVGETFRNTDTGLLRAAVLRATETQRFRDWGIAALAEPDYWSDEAARDLVDVVGREEIKRLFPLADEELDALYANMPTEAEEAEQAEHSSAITTAGGDALATQEDETTND